MNLHPSSQAGYREATLMAPWCPGDLAEWQLLERSGQVRFKVHREEQVLARGVMEGAT